jgi:hypothetical protein
MSLGILKGVESKDSGVVMLHGKVTIGASGAVSTDDSSGFATTKAATGRYTFTLDHKYPEFLGAIVNIDAQGTPSDLKDQIYTEYTVASGAITFSLLAGTTETNPASGDTLFVTLIMKKTTVQ